MGYINHSQLRYSYSLLVNCGTRFLYLFSSGVKANIQPCTESPALEGADVMGPLRERRCVSMFCISPKSVLSTMQRVNFSFPLGKNTSHSECLCPWAYCTASKSAVSLGLLYCWTSQEDTSRLHYLQLCARWTPSFSSNRLSLCKIASKLITRDSAEPRLFSKTQTLANACSASCFHFLRESWVASGSHASRRAHPTFPSALFTFAPFGLG